MYPSCQHSSQGPSSTGFRQLVGAVIQNLRVLFEYPEQNLKMFSDHLLLGILDWLSKEVKDSALMSKFMAAKGIRDH